jgi:amino-acid N-acetyltransferase
LADAEPILFNADLRDCTPVACQQPPEKEARERSTAKTEGSAFISCLTSDPCPSMMIRPATIHDVPRIQDVINSHAELGKMLFKSYAQLYEDLRDFGVYEIDGEAVGCVALTIIWADLAEIRSLAVDDAHRGKRIGTQLVEWTVEEARRLGIRKLMALTYEQRFFEKLGFEAVAKETLPLKVWSDCVRCPKQDGCDEIAVVRVLQDVESPLLPLAQPTPRGVSIPVLQSVEE